MPKGKSGKWYRVYNNSGTEVSERPYECYSADQAVTYYVKVLLGQPQKRDNYYAIEVDGPNGWRRPQPPTPAKPRPPRQMGLDLSDF